MKATKYYDHKRCRPIELDKDGCTLCDWTEQFDNAIFAKHPKGFPIFLPPHELEKSDEYKESDPYTVELNLDSDFHRRRIQCTLTMIEEAIKKVEGVPKLLDLGCGQGHITSKIKESYPSIEISALDYSVSAIEYAVDHFHGIDFAVGNAYAPPYAESYFDIVVCNNLWEHVPDPLYLLSAIKMVIKPNSFLIISTPSRYRLGNLIRVMMGRTVIFMSEHHVTEYSVGQVLEQLTYGGFKVSKVLSKRIKDKSLKSRIAKVMFSSIISIVGSHHQLEATVFYLAQLV